MVPLQYVYALASLPICAVWLFLFLRRKDERAEMLVMTFTFAFGSVMTAYLWWTHDWWQPLTITGTRVGPEDFLLGVWGGVIGVSYEALFGLRHFNHRGWKKHLGTPILVIMLWLVIGLCTWGLGFTSFSASSFALLLVAFLIYVQRPDLLQNGIYSGLIAVSGSLILGYLPIMLMNPTWIPSTYLWQHLSGITPLGVPIEEFIFWFLAGLVFGPWYEYWKGDGLRAVSRRVA